MSVLALFKSQEYGIVTVHFAVVPLTVAFTVAVSEKKSPLLSVKTEASAAHTIVSLARFVDLIVIVKLNTNFPVVAAGVRAAASSSSGRF
jgi:hypothetical protein